MFRLDFPWGTYFALQKKIVLLWLLKIQTLLTSVPSFPPLAWNWKQEEKVSKYFQTASLIRLKGAGSEIGKENFHFVDRTHAGNIKGGGYNLWNRWSGKSEKKWMFRMFFEIGENWVKAWRPQAESNRGNWTNIGFKQTNIYSLFKLICSFSTKICAIANLQWLFSCHSRWEECNLIIWAVWMHFVYLFSCLSCKIKTNCTKFVKSLPYFLNVYSNTVWKTRGFEHPNDSKTVFQLYLQAGTRGLAAKIANLTFKQDLV